MRGNALLLVGPGRSEGGSAWAEALSRRWTLERTRPAQLRHASLDEVAHQPRTLDNVTVAWLVPEEHAGSRLLEAIAQLQDRRIPALLSRADERLSPGASYQSGVIVAGRDQPADIVLALLRVLWTQAEMVGEFDQEISLLRAHQVGLADQIGKMDEELRMASRLQKEFLPTEFPTLHDFGARVLFRPASYVSGDIYEFTRLDEDHLGFFVADAVGHGVPAALLTVSIKRSLRTKEIGPDHPAGYRLIPPGEALCGLNRDLIEMQAGRIRTATAAYGVLNARTRELEIARAGHPYPLLMKADGEIRPLDPEGGMLGVFPDEVFQTLKVQLEPTDRLLIYSDGFELAFRGCHGDSGTHQYLDELARLNQGSLDEALAALERKLDGQTGSLNQDDDLTALLIGHAVSPGRRARSHRFGAKMTSPAV
ncbi:MAG: serine/threonine-protein phosphatase [Phycisphaeraceae bacterium]|nr:serine/threonine-protein phosphatase [Phycisphaeraceae bacterium]